MFGCGRGGRGSRASVHAGVGGGDSTRGGGAKNFCSKKMKAASTTAGRRGGFQQLMGINVHNTWGNFFLSAQVLVGRRVGGMWKKTLKFRDCQRLHTMLKHASLNQRT
jgi:hypothetical protein